MIIVHVIGYFQPELGYKEYFLAKEQVKLGHHVHVVTSDRIYPFPNIAEISQQLNLPPTRQRPAGQSVLDGIFVHRLPTAVEVGSAILVRGLKEALAEIQPDTAILHGPVHALPAVASRLMPKKTRLLVEDQQFRLPQTLRGKIFFWLIGWWLCQLTFRRAAVINFPTPQTELFARRYYRLPAVPMTHIPLGYDADVFRDQPDMRVQLRDKLGISDSRCVFLFAGKLQQGKNLELLLKAFARLSPDSKASLVIIGGGDQRYKQDLEQLAGRLKITNKLYWSGLVPRPQLSGWYNAADVGVWPDWPSITILEAMGSGLPVIIPNSQWGSHLVEAGNGTTFMAGSVDGLADAMRQMLNPETRRALKRTTQQVREKFSYTKIAAEFVAAAARV